VLGARPSKSRPEMGLVNFRSHLVNSKREAVMEMTAILMFGRRAAPADNEVTP